jgi:hypothetical protein
VIVLDSVLILSPAALEFATGAIGRTDGVVSLYNSLAHEELCDIDAELVEKRSFGGAGTFWDARLLERFIADIRESPWGWDWQAVAFLEANRLRIIASRRSYAQHLGISGANNRWFGKIDYGRGFVIETANQARFMAASFDTLMTRQKEFRPPRPAKGKASRLFKSIKIAMRRTTR